MSPSDQPGAVVTVRRVASVEELVQLEQVIAAQFPPRRPASARAAALEARFEETVRSRSLPSEPARLWAEPWRSVVATRSRSTSWHSSPKLGDSESAESSWMRLSPRRSVWARSRSTSAEPARRTGASTGALDSPVGGRSCTRACRWPAASWPSGADERCRPGKVAPREWNQATDRTQV